MKYSHRHITFLICVLLLFICNYTNNAYSQTPQISNFEKQDYEAANQNWSIAFDKTGLAYFGNSMGLLEFDGITWDLHQSPNGAIIRAVAISDDNRIYTGGFRELGFWQKDASEILQYHSLSSLIEEQFTTNEEFWNIFIIDERVYFHSFSGIFIYESGSFKVIKPGGYVNYATQLGNTIYFTIKDKGIYKISGDSFIPVEESPFFANKTIRFFSANTSNNTFVIGTESNGVFLYNEATHKFIPWLQHLKNFFVENKINHGVRYTDNKIIIGTILAGIVIIGKSGEMLYHLDVDKGLQSNTVLGLSFDNFENIWLALDKGIDFISFAPSQAFSLVENNEIGALYSAALHNNIMYLGTNQGLYKRNWDNYDLPFELIPGTQEQVWDCKIIDKSLFVGHNLGTFEINSDKINKISNYSGGYSIIKFPQNPNLLIQSTYSDLVVYKKELGKWTFSHTIDGFNNLIRHLAFDHLNNLWASHLYQGVYKIVLNDELNAIKTIKHYGKNSVFGKYGQNTNVFEVENRIVFTTDKLLYTYNDLNDSIVPYDLLNKKLGKYAASFRIVPAPGHRYWFISKSGIACFEINLDSIRKIKEYPKALFENQLVPKYENIVPLSKKKALVCLENGYALINTEFADETNDISNQQLQLKEVIITDKNDNKQLLSTSVNNISIPFTRNNLLVRYSFPYFTNEKVRFQYRIEGLDNNWSPPLEKPIFNIKRIPPGKYKLRVKAINGWGNSSKFNDLTFTVTPPWYNTSLAYLIYLLLFALFAVFSGYLTIKRVKIIEKRKRLDKERELIQLRNEKLRDEISFKSQQLANSTMGIIKKNEFLLSLKEKLKKQKDSLGTRYPDKYFQSIVKKIDENISGQDDWNVFEANFVQAHETFLKNLKQSFPDLTPSDLRLCAYLRINLTSKEIAPLLGISVRGVENHRYRLRKKLQLDSDDNLTDFILAI